MNKNDFLKRARKLFDEMENEALDKRVTLLNKLRAELHKRSPFNAHPVDLIQWVKAEDVHANDYNPNSVAPPEMELLRLSIAADGYTQPIVTNKEAERLEVIDGFHRNRVGKECPDIQASLKGYLPVVQIRQSQLDKSDRMAATIRHNRARGKHRVESMSEIVLELKRRNWSDEKIGKQLGMDQDEVLRLTQIAGLADMFKGQEFSEAWEAERLPDDTDDFVLTDDLGSETEVFIETSISSSR